MATKRIVILGGGFAGTYAARRLDRTLARRSDVQVVLIARENYLLFTPMLHEVAAGDLDPADIVSPVRKVLRRVRFVEGEVVSVDLPQRRVCFEVGPLRRPHELAYDHLVLAVGSETNYFGMPGLEANASTLKSLTDATLLRNRMIALLEEAAAEDDPRVRGRLLTFVVAGGGFAGVETVGAINDFLRGALRYYPELHPSMLRLVLVHSGKVVLPELGEKLGRYAQDMLRRRGVDVRLGTRVVGYGGHTVRMTPEETLEAATVVGTAGVAPAAAIASLPVEKVNGRVRVSQFLEVVGHEGVVWAAGDCAAVPDGRGGTHPPTAQHGMREAIVAAKNVEAAVDGTAKRPFRFSTLGQLATIGRRDGVAQVFGLRFSGFVAWLLWRTVYLAKLPGLAKRVRVAIKWSLDLLFAREVEQIMTIRDVEQIERFSAGLRAVRTRTRSVPVTIDPKTRTSLHRV